MARGTFFWNFHNRLFKIDILWSYTDLRTQPDYIQTILHFILVYGLCLWCRCTVYQHQVLYFLSLTSKRKKDIYGRKKTFEKSRSLCATMSQLRTEKIKKEVTKVIYLSAVRVGLNCIQPETGSLPLLQKPDPTNSVRLLEHFRHIKHVDNSSNSAKTLQLLIAFAQNLFFDFEQKKIYFCSFSFY